MIATSEACVVQALQARDAPIFGTQFHPELYDDAHPDGAAMLRAFVAAI